MKKFFKFFVIFLLVVVVAAAAGLIYFNSKYPDVEPAKDLKFEYTSQMLERGKYLANHVAACIDCHSTRNWSYFSGPVIPGTEGKGGDKFGSELGIPGEVYVKNITPAALSSWTDGELFRVITSGVRKNGDVLFPMMPYTYYSRMSEEDVRSIIAYIRSLKPIENNIPETTLNFPVNMIIKSVPKTYTPPKSVDKNNPSEYGKYLVTIGGCMECHSPTDKGEILKGKEFSGGVTYDLPFGTIRTANITPDMETGIGGWSKEVFIARFKYFLNEESTKMRSDNVQTIMPWTLYAGMTEEDLGAIYDYLRTVSPVKNRVVTYSPPNQQFMNARK